MADAISRLRLEPVASETNAHRRNGRSRIARCTTFTVFAGVYRISRADSVRTLRVVEVQSSAADVYPVLVVEQVLKR